MRRVGGAIICCLVLGLLLTPLVTGTAYGQSKANVVVKEWKIPILLHVTGSQGGIGIDQRWLFERVASEINAAGGISGRPMVTELCDTAMDPTKAAACMAKAIDAGALLTYGPTNDMECKAALPLASRAGIFSFAGAPTTEVAKQFYPWTIYVLAPTEETVQVQMELWVKHQPEIKSVVGLEEPVNPFVHTLQDGFQRSIKKMGLNAKGIILVPSGMADYSAAVVRAMGTGADAFTIGGSGEVSAKLVNELVSHGANPTHIYLAAGNIGPEFLDQCKGHDEGVYSGWSPTYGSTPEFARLSKLFKESHGGKPWAGLTAVAYDMIYMIKASIEKTGVTGDPAKLKEEREKVRDYALNQKQFHGIDAVYDVANGLAVRYPERIFHVHNDAMPLVEEIIPKAAH